VTSVRNCEKLPPCLIEPMPTGSKTDLPLAKVEPISDSASASVVTFIKGEKVTAQQQFQQRERSENL